MIRDLGIVEPGKTLYIPFHTFDSNDPSASVTLTGLATTDIEVYKDGSVTQRASDAGYALLDTDGIDFDATTGIHGISIDLADNTTAGFYASGSQYWVVIASVTVDAATVNFVLCTFRIGYQAARLNTTIATLASQTSFTLTVGPAEDDALNGCWCIIHDVASAVQQGHAVISDYTGSTKTVTLAAGTTFTVAATDNIAVIGPMPMQPTVSGRTLDVSSTGEAGLDWANIGSPTTANNLSATNIDVDQVVASVSGAVGSVTGAVGSVTGNVGGNVAGSVASVTAGVTVTTNNDKTGYALSAAGVDAVWDEATAGHVTAGTYGVAVSDILVDTSTTLQAELDGLQADTEDLQTRIPAALVGGRIDASVGAMAANVLTATAINADAITAAKVAADVHQETIELAFTYDATASYATATTGALVKEIADNAGGSALTAAAIADAVWDEAQADHVAAGSFGVTASEIADILVDTAEIGAAGAGLTAINLPDQTMNITGNISGNLSGSVGSVTGAVGSVTGAVGSVTGAVGSVTGNVDGNVTGSIGSLAAQAKLDVKVEVDTAVADMISGIITGAAATGTLSTTQATSNLTGYADDQFIGRVIIWLTGACEGEATDITDYASASGLLTFTALTTAPSNGGTFKIV